MKIVLGNRRLGARGVLIASLIAAIAVVMPSVASANVTPTINKTYSTTVPGAVADTTITMDFAYGDTAEDLKNVSFEIAAGSLGDLSAIPYHERCTDAQSPFNSMLDAPYYAGCPASAKIGTGRLVLEHPTLLLTCTLTGNIYLLQDSPELPAYVGSHLINSSPCFAGAAGAVQSVTTSKIEVLTNSDFRLRTTLMPETTTDADGDGDFSRISAAVRVKTIEENIDGILDNGRAFMRNPTRCDTWETAVNAAAFDSNTNFNYDINGDGTNDRVRATKQTTPDCSTLPSFAPKMSVQLSSKVRGQSPDASFVIETGSPLADSHIKTVKTLLPPGLNSNLTGRSVCTTEQRNTNTCPANSKVGSALLYAPHLMGTFTGEAYLVQDSPLPGFAIYFTGNGISFRLDGKNNQAPDGSLVTEFTNLPQQPFTRFELTLTGGEGGTIAVRGCPSDASTPPGDTFYYDMTSWANQLTQTSLSLGLPECRGVTVASVENCVSSKLNVAPIYRDRADVTQAELFINKRRVKTTTKSPYKFGLNVSKFSAREHEIKVRATYNDGKRKVDKATFTKCAKKSARKRAGQRRTEPRFTG